MKSALRLWWLLRGTGGRLHTAPVGVAFGLLTWTALTAAALVQLSSAGSLDGPLTTALSALLAALGLTAAVALCSLGRRTDERRLAVLRSAGACQVQTSLVCLFEVLEAAIPGVLAGVAAHLGLGILADRAGIDLTVGGLLTLCIALVLATTTVGLVVWKVRGVLHPQAA